MRIAIIPLEEYQVLLEKSQQEQKLKEKIKECIAIEAQLIHGRKGAFYAIKVDKRKLEQVLVDYVIPAEYTFGSVGSGYAIVWEEGEETK